MAEATRISTSYATSTWNPSRFGKKRTASRRMLQNAPPVPNVVDDIDESIESVETIGAFGVGNESSRVEAHVNKRIAPASAKAALIAVVSATVIGGARHAMELVL